MNRVQLMIGWLVNDRLTAIPGTRTMWHLLLDWLPGLIDKTGGYTSYDILADVIERDAELSPPEYIIRNCSYFRNMNIAVPTISYLQDNQITNNGALARQLKVCNTSTMLVFNSDFMRNLYKDKVTTKTTVIPIGTDFELFSPYSNDRKEELRKKLGILNNSILFIGDSSAYPKGFDIIQDLIKNTDYNFCLIMKDNFSINHPRVRVFNRVSQSAVADICNCCAMLICASRMETLHLSGVEAGACGLPILASNVGIYNLYQNGAWGIKLTDNPASDIEFVFNNYISFSPRQFFYNQGFDLESCKNKWVSLIGGLYE